MLSQRTRRTSLASSKPTSIMPASTKLVRHPFQFFACQLSHFLRILLDSLLDTGNSFGCIAYVVRDVCGRYLNPFVSIARPSYLKRPTDNDYKQNSTQSSSDKQRNCDQYCNAQKGQNKNPSQNGLNCETNIGARPENSEASPLNFKRNNSRLRINRILKSEREIEENTDEMAKQEANQDSRNGVSPQ